MPLRRGLFGDGILRLALGADKQHQLAFGYLVGDELGRFLEHLQRLLQVDDVNPVALAEDVFLHLRIPAFGLMPEVNASFEQLLHRDICQATSSVLASFALNTRSGLLFPVTRTRVREEFVPVATTSTTRPRNQKARSGVRD